MLVSTMAFGVLWEADVGCVHGPHLLRESSWPAESLLSWGSDFLDDCRVWVDRGASCSLSQLLPC